VCISGAVHSIFIAVRNVSNKLHGKQEALGRTSSLLSLDTIGIALKSVPSTVLSCRGNVFPETLSCKDNGINILRERERDIERERRGIGVVRDTTLGGGADGNNI
jgi:hypothetical protein